MKKKTEKIPDKYRELRATASPGYNGQRWVFEWYEPGPHFGAAPALLGERLTRLRKRKANEKFVRLEGAEEFMALKKRELARVWKGRGSIIAGVFDPEAIAATEAVEVE